MTISAMRSFSHPYFPLTKANTFFWAMILALCHLILIPGGSAQIWPTIDNFSSLCDDLEVTLVSTNFTCDGADVCVSVTGGTSPYTFTLNNEDNDPGPNTGLTICFPDLTPGQYTLIVTDMEGCTTNLEFNIPFVDYYLNANVTDLSCHGGHDGAIQLEILIDIAPLFYEWEGPNGYTANTEFIENLEPGTYSVSVTTIENSCVGIGSWIVSEPPPLEMEVIFSTPTCGPVNVCVFVSGGTSPYQLWAFPNLPDVLANSPTGQIGPLTDLDPTGAIPFFQTSVGGTYCANNVPDGVYFLLVLDANFCYLWEQITVMSNTAIEREVEVQHISCHGENDGQICFKITNGTPPFLTSIGDPAGTVGIPGPEGCFENLVPGTYTITSTDGTGCSLSETVYVHEPAPLNATFEITSPPCTDQIDGCLSIEGGTFPYYIWVWEWPDPTSDVLPAVVMDTDGNYDIPDADPVNSIDFIGDAIAPNIICAQDIPEGYYLVLVVDSNGCYFLLPVCIPGATGLDVDFEITSDDCSEQVDGCLTVSGGEAPYNIWVWYWPDPTSDVLPPVTFNDDGTPVIEDAVPTDVIFFETDPSDPFIRCAQNIPAGFYLVLVVDAEGCYSLLPIIIPEPGPFDINLDYDPFGSYACVDPSGGLPPYHFRWLDLISNVVISNEPCVENLGPGFYLIVVKDGNGCRVDAILIIDEMPCIGGEASVDPEQIQSGENTTFYLNNYSGMSLQWQFKTEITPWLNIPGATSDVYETPSINTGADKTIQVRAAVLCQNGDIVYSTVTEFKVEGSNLLADYHSLTEDPQLFNPAFRMAELLALQQAPANHVNNAEVVVFPTFPDEEIHLRLEFDSPNRLTINIVNQLGAKIYQKQSASVYRGDQYTLPASHLPPGVYYVQVQSEEYLFTERFIKK